MEDREYERHIITRRSYSRSSIASEWPATGSRAGQHERADEEAAVFTVFGVRVVRVLRGAIVSVRLRELCDSVLKQAVTVTYSVTSRSDSE